MMQDVLKAPRLSKAYRPPEGAQARHLSARRAGWKKKKKSCQACLCFSCRHVCEKIERRHNAVHYLLGGGGLCSRGGFRRRWSYCCLVRYSFNKSPRPGYTNHFITTAKPQLSRLAGNEIAIRKESRRYRIIWGKSSSGLPILFTKLWPDSLFFTDCGHTRSFCQ